jgi:hypothetical protein
VPRLSHICSLVMPIPVSIMEIVLSLELVEIEICKSAPDWSIPEVILKRYFSRASEQLDSNSLRNTSLSV